MADHQLGKLRTRQPLSGDRIKRTQDNQRAQQQDSESGEFAMGKHVEVPTSEKERSNGVSVSEEYDES